VTFNAVALNKRTLRSIELYKAKPVLYDPTYNKYYNKHTKYEASEELSKLLGFWNN
jgi:ribosomal protein S17